MDAVHLEISEHKSLSIGTSMKKKQFISLSPTEQELHCFTNSKEVLFCLLTWEDDVQFH